MDSNVHSYLKVLQRKWDEAGDMFSRFPVSHPTVRETRGERKRKAAMRKGSL